VPGAQAEYLRVPQAQFMPIKVPEGPADERFLFLSDVLPTAWQSVVYADVPKDGTLLVLGLGPIGDMATRIALHQGFRVIAVDVVPERLEWARVRGAEVIDLTSVDDVADEVRSRTHGRGADAVIDAVGMEAHGSPVAEVGQRIFNALPQKLSAQIMSKVGRDRMSAIHTAIDAVRRGGTVSVIGVYGGQSDPMPIMTMFDKQIQLRMGQANVKRWVDDIMPLLVDDADPLGVEQFATHTVPLAEAPTAYEKFQKKQDGTVKVVFKP
jgi:S-(hydroxymethyl)glutathione dehydrogenase/alcohol dehydrogenase